MFNIPKIAVLNPELKFIKGCTQCVKATNVLRSSIGRHREER